MPTTRPPSILLRSSWQTINIGDVAHSPGALLALRRHRPDAKLTLWPVDIGEREATMLRELLPEVGIVVGRIGEDGTPDTLELEQAFDEHDLLLHGSGPSMLVGGDLTAWAATTGKPYGVFGITMDALWPSTTGSLQHLRSVVRELAPGHLRGETRAVLEGAAFVFCRDSITLDYLNGQGVASPVLAFGPDATFAFDGAEDAAAAAILSDYGLTDGRFLCLVLKKRYTSYYRIHGRDPVPEDLRREAVNAIETPRDLAILSEVAADWVRDTGLPVLVCPEMEYQVELAQQMVPLLPADVRDVVHVLPAFWQVHEAAATYARAAAVISLDCHSPILAIVHGTPARYLRQPTESVKGAMFADLGMEDIVDELDDGSACRVRSFLAGVRTDSSAFRHQVRTGHEVATTALDSMSATAFATIAGG